MCIYLCIHVYMLYVFMCLYTLLENENIIGIIDHYVLEDTRILIIITRVNCLLNGVYWTRVYLKIPDERFIMFNETSL